MKALINFFCSHPIFWRRSSLIKSHGTELFFFVCGRLSQFRTDFHRSIYILSRTATYLHFFDLFEYLCHWIFVLLNICVLFFFRSSILHACSSYFSVPWNYSCSVVLCFQMVLYFLQVTTSIFTTKHYSSSHLFFRLKIQQFLKKFRKIQVPTRKKYTKSKILFLHFSLSINFDAIASDFIISQKTLKSPCHNNRNFSLEKNSKNHEKNVVFFDEKT